MIIYTIYYIIINHNKLFITIICNSINTLNMSKNNNNYMWIFKDFNYKNHAFLKLLYNPFFQIIIYPSYLYISSKIVHIFTVSRVSFNFSIRIDYQRNFLIIFNDKDLHL